MTGVQTCALPIYVESLIPFSFGIPGIKLGLTNVVTVIMMYTYGIPGALGVAVLRAVLSGFMFGNAFSIIYSVAGCVLSFIFMYILKKTNHFAIISVFSSIPTSFSESRAFIWHPNVFT